MKIRFCAALLIAVLAIPLFAGCAAAEDSIESRMGTVQTEASVPMSAPTAAPAVPAALLTKEEAIAIALKDAGFTEAQVTHLRSELDYDHGRAEYEVDFHVDRWEYDYEIDAETGRIISSDKDFED